jgi:hypothetical protein
MIAYLYTFCPKVLHIFIGATPMLQGFFNK